MFPFAFWKAAASGFNPLSVTGCQLWYDASVCTHGAGVTALPDQSGNARHATVSGTLTYTATNAAYNNRPTINRADATDDILMPDMGITTGAFTLVLVADAPTAAYNYMLRNGGVDVRAQSGMWRVSADGGLTLLDSAALTVTDPTVIIAVVNGASSELYTSAVTPASGTTGAQPDMTGVGMYVGDASAGGSGDLNFTHALVYTGALSAGDIAYLLNGFGAQCGITIGP